MPSKESSATSDQLEIGPGGVPPWRSQFDLRKRSSRVEGERSRRVAGCQRSFRHVAIDNRPGGDLALRADPDIGGDGCMRTEKDALVQLAAAVGDGVRGKHRVRADPAAMPRAWIRIQS